MTEEKMLSVNLPVKPSTGYTSAVVRSKVKALERKWWSGTERLNCCEIYRMSSDPCTAAS